MSDIDMQRMMGQQSDIQPLLAQTSQDDLHALERQDLMDSLQKLTTQNESLNYENKMLTESLE